MSNKFSIAENVAADMKSLLDSDSYKQVFSRPVVKEAAKDDKDDKAKKKEKEKKEKEKAKAKAKKEKEKQDKKNKKNKKAGLTPMPIVLQEAMNGIISVAELLEAASLEKSAALATIALKSIVAEAEELGRSGRLVTAIKIAKKKDDDDEDEEEDEDDEEEDEKDEKDKDDANDVSFAKDKDDKDDKEEKEEKEEDEDEDEKEDENDVSLAGAPGDPLEGLPEEGGDELIESIKNMKPSGKIDPWGGTKHRVAPPASNQPSFKELDEQIRQTKPEAGGGAYKQPTYRLPSLEEPSAARQKAHEYVPRAPSHPTRGPSPSAVAPRAPAEAKPQSKQVTPSAPGVGGPFQHADDGEADAAAASDGSTSASPTPSVNAYPTDDTYADAARNDPNKTLPERAASVLNSWFKKMAMPMDDVGDEHERGNDEDLDSLISELENMDLGGNESEAFEESSEADDGIELESVANFQEYLAKVAKKKSGKTDKWIPKDLKKDRFKGWSLSKMKSRYSALEKKEKKSKDEVSEMRALALGIRFKGGDVPGGKKKKGL